MALDVGDRRIGLAISDALGLTAQPAGVLTRTDLPADLKHIVTTAQQRQVEKILVGLPMTLRGEQGPQAKKVIAFRNALDKYTTIPIEMVDERLTTAQAERVMLEGDASRQTRKELIDQVAAQLILQHYLDAKAHSHEPENS